MSVRLYNPDIDGKLETINNQPKINYGKQPEYLKQRDIEDEKASVEFNKEQQEKIVEESREKMKEQDFEADPVSYEATKLGRSIVKTFGKIF
jgi:hypothetical protein